VGAFSRRTSVHRPSLHFSSLARMSSSTQLCSMLYGVSPNIGRFFSSATSIVGGLSFAGDPETRRLFFSRRCRTTPPPPPPPPPPDPLRQVSVDRRARRDGFSARSWGWRPRPAAAPVGAARCSSLLAEAPFSVGGPARDISPRRAPRSRTAAGASLSQRQRPMTMESRDACRSSKESKVFTPAFQS